jgi:hypothetical protein
MTAVKMTFFAIGTLACFVAVYLAVKHPDLVEGPVGYERETTMEQEHPLKKWDNVITWVMWGGWGLCALTYYLDNRLGVFD